jgi:AcrR family transcriptional regulator
MTSTRHLSSEERKVQTVRAVIDLCGKQDPARVTTADMARHMRVTQGALFRHFPSKDAIWEAVVNWVGEALMRRLDAAAAGTREPLDTLEAIFMAHIGFILDHPGVPRLLLGQLQHGGQTPARRMVHSLLSRYRDRVESLLWEGQRVGEVRGDLDVAAAATQFIGTIQGLVVQSLVAEDSRLIAGQAEHVFRIYRNGVRVDAGEGT